MVHAISILGSTGSIGRQTAQAARRLGLPVLSLSGQRNIDLLEQQSREFHPRYISVMEPDAARELRQRMSDTDVEIGTGEESLIKAATIEGADCVVTGVSGSIGLRPTLAAIRQNKRIALANKETLVCAGDIVMAEAARCEAGSLRLKPLAVSVLSAHPDSHRPLDQAILARNAQAAFRPILLAGHLKDFGVDELDDLLLLSLGNVRLNHEDCAAQDTDLRRGKADAVGIDQRLPHIVQKLMKPGVKIGHRTAFLIQSRLFFCQNITKCH